LILDRGWGSPQQRPEYSPESRSPSLLRIVIVRPGDQHTEQLTIDAPAEAESTDD